MKTTELQDGDLLLERVYFKKSWNSRKGLAKFRALLPWLIRLFDGGYYNHVKIYAGGFIIDPDYPQVRLLHHEAAKHNQVMVLRLNKSLTINEGQIYRNWCYSLVERDYKWHHLLVHLVKCLTGVWLGSWADTEGVCSKYSLLPINRLRGYFPRFPQMSPNDILKQASLYYYVEFEGVLD